METSAHEAWARLRFAVVGPLLVSPPPAGQLRAEFERLSRRSWDHPSGKGQVCFAVPTIERWYYQARSHENPVKALGKKGRSDKGVERAISSALIEVLREQYRLHPTWSAQLHWDNLAARVAEDPSLGPMPRRCAGRCASAVWCASGGASGSRAKTGARTSRARC